MTRLTDKELTHSIIGCAIEVHRVLGPGLLEAVYEECLAKELALRGITFERQKPIPLVYRDLMLDAGYRLDLLVDGRVVVEVKAVENVPAIVEPIMLTYLRHSGCRLGLVINFWNAVLRDGIRRYVWHYEVPPQEKDDAEAQRSQSIAEKNSLTQPHTPTARVSENA
jgi:GxxExxY protein